ncbi:MAG: cell division protein SepF [Candidatus Micrarchaeia archaeon]
MVFKELSKALGLSREMNLDEFMSAAEAEEVDVMHESADFYVKPISLQTEADVKIVEEELKNRNIVLLNITPIARNPQKLKDAIASLRKYASDLNGDVARIDENKILLTPARVKIVKKRR